MRETWLILPKENSIFEELFILFQQFFKFLLREN